MFSHRYKPGVRTPTRLQINIAQLWRGSCRPRRQADLMRQSYEPLFVTENNSSSFTASPVKPPFPLAGHGRAGQNAALLAAWFCSSTAAWAGHRLYFNNWSPVLLPTHEQRLAWTPERLLGEPTADSLSKGGKFSS